MIVKRLFIIRHAKSSWSSPELSDHDRPLNKRGSRDAPYMADRLHLFHDEISLICSSTAIRARATAAFFQKEFEIPDESFNLISDLYLCGENQLVDIIRELPNNQNNVAIFGHNPGWTYFTNMIPNVRIDNVPTCGISIIDYSGDDWSKFSVQDCSLERFLYPKQLTH